MLRGFDGVCMHVLIKTEFRMFYEERKMIAMISIF